METAAYLKESVSIIAGEGHREAVQRTVCGYIFNQDMTFHSASSTIGPASKRLHDPLP